MHFIMHNTIFLFSRFKINKIKNVFASMKKHNFEESDKVFTRALRDPGGVEPRREVIFTSVLEHHPGCCVENRMEKGKSK